MTCMVTISDSQCESLRLHLVFSILLFHCYCCLTEIFYWFVTLLNIIYLSIVYIVLIFLYCVYFCICLILSWIENDQNNSLFVKNILFE